MNDIKLFAKNEQELETLIHIVRIYSQDIGMEFDIEKCTILVMKSRKWHLANGMELPNPEKMKMLEENETYKYLWILEADTMKQVEMNEKKKEYHTKIRKLLETKLNCRNLIKEPRKIFGTILEVDQGKTSTKGSENKNTIGHA